MKRFIVELGTGADLHGGDVTKAAKRAVSDAMSHCCLCGISELHHNMKDMHVKIKVACPKPEEIKQEELLQMIPFGKASIEEVVNGGMSTRGLHIASLGEGDQIVVAVVSLTVYIEE